MRSTNIDTAKYALSENKDCGPWQNSIQEATMYAFFFASENERHDINPSTVWMGTKEEILRVDRSLVYLEELQLLLEQQDHKEGPPLNPSHPPSFFNEDRRDDLHSTSGRRDDYPSCFRTNESNSTSKLSSSRSKKKKKKSKNSTNKTNNSIANAQSRMYQSTFKNRYASIAFDNDDSITSNDSDIEGDIETLRIDTNRTDSNVYADAKIEMSLSIEAEPYVPSLSFGEDEDSEGGVLHLQQQPQPQANQEQQSPQHDHMDTLRLLIRLYASQSDLHAKKARLLAVQRKWLLGAGALQSSIVALTKGLDLADTAISAIDVFTDTAYATTGWAEFSSPQEIIASYNVPPTIGAVEEFTDHRRAELQKDAQIISVSTCYLVDEKDRYIKLAHREVAKLEKILNPLWKGREAAKKRIGNGQWKSNTKTNPKPSYLTKTRRKHEEELWSLEEALKQLDFSEAATSSLVEEADRLRERLKQLRFTKNRYNGRRHHVNSPQTVVDPEHHETRGSSNLELIADDHDWEFTGSIGGVDCVQFFEKWIDVRFEGQSPATIPKTISHPNWSTECDLAVNPASGIANIDEIAGSFVLVKLDYYFLTGAVQTVVEYPTVYNDEGVVIQPAWSSTLRLDIDKDDVDGVALYRQVMMDPLTAHSFLGGSNVALLHS